jgi:osmotically inducible protein OsmC
MSLVLARETAKAGLKPDQVKTEAVLTVEEKRSNWEITKIEVHVTAVLPEMDEEAFHKVSRNAKNHCLIARALNIPISMTTKLEGIHSALIA